MAVDLVSRPILAKNMKLTKNKALSMLGGLKSGLSILMAIVLMSSTILTQKAYAASTDSVTALFGIDQQNALEEPETLSTVQDTLLKVCMDHGYDEECAKHLFGILMQESMGKATAKGDYDATSKIYWARGWFQINRYYNPDVSIKCAEDITCSAEWTLAHLEKKGYPQNVNRAIWCHNGCGINKAYVPAVKKKTSLYWNTPMTLVTAEELRAIALK